MRSKSLTPREREVLRLVATGMLNKQIAGEFGITEGTVKQHRASVMRKLHVVSVADLVRLVDNGLDAEDPITSALRTRAG
jgi:FixJ family two-component response regulator